MDSKEKGWKQFRRTKLNRKQLVRHAKKIEGATQRHAHRFVVRRIDSIKEASREITIWLATIGAIIVGMGLQLTWGQQGFMTTAAVKGGAYIEGVVGKIDTLNPLYVSSNSEASVSRLLFSSLYNYDEQGALHQDLATGLSIDETNKIYTITIRDNARWHDKQLVTADDIVFTLGLIKNPAVRSPLRVNWVDVAVKKIDATTVQFTIPAVYAAFPHALTFPILPKHILGSVPPGGIRENAFSQAPVGSGPFSFRLLQQADAVSQHKVVHLTGSEGYYAGTPKLSRFEIHAYQDSTALVKALKAGELTGASDVPPNMLESIGARKFTRIAAAQDNGVYLLLNQNNAFLKEAGVRKALQVGTDTAAIRKAVGGDQIALDLPVLGWQIAGDEVPKAPAYSLVKSKELLDTAGWKMVRDYREKDGKRLELTLTTIKDSKYERAIREIEKQWQLLGIVVHTKIIDTSGATSTFVQDTLQARNFDILLYELAIGADPDVYAYWHSSQIGQTGYNFSGYTNKTADANLSSARSRLEPALRNIKYRQFSKQWLEDAPAIGLYQPVVEYIVSDTANAVEPGSQLVTAADRYANVQYWTVNRAAVYKTP